MTRGADKKIVAARLVNVLEKTSRKDISSLAIALVSRTDGTYLTFQELISRCMPSNILQATHRLQGRALTITNTSRYIQVM